MAIIARFQQPASVTGDFKMALTWDYYDDQDPANANVSLTVPPTNVLVPPYTFVFDPSDTSLPEIQERVLDIGRKVEQIHSVITGFNAAVPVGFPVVITPAG